MLRQQRALNIRQVPVRMLFVQTLMTQKNPSSGEVFVPTVLGVMHGIQRKLRSALVELLCHIRLNGQAPSH